MVAILKYELRQLRWHTWWWSAGCAMLIYAMLPVYISLLASEGLDIGSLAAGNDLFELLGIDPYVLATPIGAFGFLTTFFAVAAGINGAFLGVKAFAKETVGKSAEFLYTKPCKRGGIFCAKVLAALLSAVAVGASYAAGAVLSALANISGGFHLVAFLLVAFSFTLIEVFFVLLGALIAVVYPKIRTPLLLSAGVAFLFYVLSALASKANIPLLKFFTPYGYFNNSAIILAQRYDADYLVAFAAFCILFGTAGYVVFRQKDTSLIS